MSKKTKEKVKLKSYARELLKSGKSFEEVVKIVEKKKWSNKYVEPAVRRLFNDEFSKGKKKKTEKKSKKTVTKKTKKKVAVRKSAAPKKKKEKTKAKKKAAKKATIKDEDLDDF